MSIRSSMVYIENESGQLHIYQEAGGGDVCLTVDTTPEKITHYGDMYLTLLEIKEIHKVLGEFIEWADKRSNDVKIEMMMYSHLFDPREDGESGKD